MPAMRGWSRFTNGTANVKAIKGTAASSRRIGGTLRAAQCSPWKGPASRWVSLPKIPATQTVGMVSRLVLNARATSLYFFRSKACGSRSLRAAPVAREIAASP